MTARRLVHVLTPGDHYSPRTGSAVPTVVHGLSAATPPGEPRPAVVVARGTYPDRYPSADILEYDLARSLPGSRYTDAASSRLGLPRFALRRELAATLRGQDDWEPSVVLAHNAPQLVPLVAARHDAVLYAHNQVLGSYGTRESARALGDAAAVVCVSDFLADQVRRRLPAGLRDRVRTVRNGVDATGFAVARPGRRDVLEVAFVGRVIPDKGVHVLLDAARLLDRDDIALTIVGRPGFEPRAPLSPYERDLRRAADGIRAHVTFESFVARDALPSLLARADVVVVPSTWPEPFALTVLEGMAAGAAVVASDIGGIPEAAGSAGILVPPGDARALADAIAALADDATLLTVRQRAARGHAKARDWDVVHHELVRELAGTAQNVA